MQSGHWQFLCLHYSAAILDIRFCILEPIRSFQLRLVYDEFYFSRLDVECFPFRLRPDPVIGSSFTWFRRSRFPSTIPANRLASCLHRSEPCSRTIASFSASMEPSAWIAKTA